MTNATLPVPPHFNPVWLVVIVLGSVLLAAFWIWAHWCVFEKAKRPGWYCLIPIYNVVQLCRIGGRSAWWTIGCLIPYVNIFALIYVFYGIARNFGKGAGFSVGMLLLSPIFFMILGFDDSRYVPIDPKSPQQPMNEGHIDDIGKV